MIPLQLYMIHIYMNINISQLDVYTAQVMQAR